MSVVELRRRPLASPLDLIGAPYLRGGVTPEAGFDCYTLAAYVRWHWFTRPTPGGEIPSPQLSCAQACARGIRRAFGGRHGELSKWQACAPAPGCIVALGRSRLSPLHHCGVWINGGVLHAFDRIGVAWTPGDRIGELFGRVEFYECRD